MPFITINVTGLDEAVSGLNAASDGLADTRKAILLQASEFMTNELKRNAHVVTGRMRDSIHTQGVSDKQAVVSVSAPYAYYENRRVGNKSGYGPHNFGDMAEAATRNMLPETIQSEMAKLFTKTIKKPFKYTHKTIGKGGRTVYHYSPFNRFTVSRPSRTIDSD